MTADDFLSTIFADAQGAVLTVNAEDGFRGRRWKPGKPLSGTVYFCISTVKDPRPRDQVLTRQTQDLVATYVIVLDDVGTKVSRETLAGRLAPTYRLETSAGNEQWGYILEEGCDPNRAASLIEALAAAGLTDKGARRADRIMRVPGSVNVPKGGFVARLLEWEPARVYSFTDICLGLGVTPSDTPALSPGPAELPAGMIDPLFQWLSDHGHVLDGPNPRGWWPVRCPQEHLHSGEVDHGTDYRPGMPGVFKCQHGHCAGSGRTWLADWVLRQDPGADLSVMPRAALEGLGKRLAGVLKPLQVSENTFVTGEVKDLAQEILADLVHVASEDKYWSYEAGGLLKGSAVDTRLHARMVGAGLLKKELRAPTIWLKHQEHMQKAKKLTHRLGAARIVDDCLNIAPELPPRVEYGGEPTPWLEVITFICKGNQEEADWFLDWCAMVVSAWDEKPGFHIILKGKQGTGKNLALLPLVTYLQPEHHQMVSTAMISSPFNAFLTRRLVSVDELKMTTRGAATAHDIYNNLKAWTARGAGTITINEKNMKHFQASDLSCWAITSNEAVPLPLEDDDRRFMVFETPHRRQSPEWYKRVYAWLAEGGTDVVIGWLQRRWDEMDAGLRQGLREPAPLTAAKQDVLDDAAEGIEGAIRLAISGRHEEAWPDLMRIDDILVKLAHPTESPLTDNIRRNHLNAKRVAMALKSAGAVRLFGGEVVSDGTRKMRLWCLRAAKVEQYEQMRQGKALCDEYASQQTGIVPDEMRKVLRFPPPHKT